ncbi:unnamed protein product [Candidula unifasciata]|uniref:SHSP domain-containing protein n=1 Tax=Candidula unifasciata TaxID=100452 RepID=A0A8S3ZSE0_9EUPU|nr:unnamed protein product [Candidula unifasciata]
MVQNTDEEFRIRLNLGKCFKPDEIKITTNDKQICIHAKHEERKDKHGSVYREMTRKYTLPPDVDPKDVSSTMNKEGVMFIKAGKKKEALEAPKEVPIRVEYKGC